MEESDRKNNQTFQTPLSNQKLESVQDGRSAYQPERARGRPAGQTIIPNIVQEMAARQNIDSPTYLQNQQRLGVELKKIVHATGKTTSQSKQVLIDVFVDTDYDVSNKKLEDFHKIEVAKFTYSNSSNKENRRTDSKSAQLSRTVSQLSDITNTPVNQKRVGKENPSISEKATFGSMGTSSPSFGNITQTSVNQKRVGKENPSISEHAKFGSLGTSSPSFGNITQTSGISSLKSNIMKRSIACVDSNDPRAKAKRPFTNITNTSENRQRIVEKKNYTRNADITLNGPSPLTINIPKRSISCVVIKDHQERSKRPFPDFANAPGGRIRNVTPKRLESHFNKEGSSSSHMVSQSSGLTIWHNIQRNDDEEFERYESTHTRVTEDEDESFDYDDGYEDRDDCDSVEDISNANKGNNSKSSGSMKKDLPPCPEYKSLGFPTKTCRHCGSTMWNEERVNKNNLREEPEFSICCAKGQIKLPKPKPTPPFLRHVYYDKEKGPKFRGSQRSYNCVLSMTSTGGNIDHSINKSRGPSVYRISGLNHHQFGTLKPENDKPKFCQLYIYDTENEITNRMKVINAQDSDQLDPEILDGLIKMLDENNVLVQKFRQARDRFEEDKIIDLKIHIKASRAQNGRENHITPSDEVAAVIVGDESFTCGERDILIQSKNAHYAHEGLQRITFIHPKLMALQYPLLFPHADDGYHDELYFDNSKKPDKKKRDKVSMKEFYSYQFQVRQAEDDTKRLGGRLYQQYTVDAFAAIEQSRLWWVKTHQTLLRNELYHNLCDMLSSSDILDPSTTGQGIILPASFVGSARYMQQNFLDSLALCRKIGYPDIFLTMTFNPLWDEVLQMMSLLSTKIVADCPDIIARVFKLKLNQLYDDIKNKNFFGPCAAVMYVVEWQKRGLPHAHMLIWLEEAGKREVKSNIDKYVSAEIPDEEKDPYGYAAVKQLMIHGPCGAGFDKSPCMKGSKCTRNFPKKYCSNTMFDDCGFPVYKRRKTKHTVSVRNAILDNQWVVPYNRDLLVRYQCHINVEICNHGRCMKYLFKYCLKGHDRATVLVQSKNKDGQELEKEKPSCEVKTYLDGRYICGPEAAHRIYGFDIHHRSMSVERLPFHLENAKPVTFKSTDNLKKICTEAAQKNSKLEAFFQLCRDNGDARKYTYQEIPEHFVWHSDVGEWRPRKRGRQVGRLNSSHYAAGELWYLRMLLSRIPGPTSYEDLRRNGDTTHNTYQEACASLGLLKDDNEWHEALEENKSTAFPLQLRSLFVHIILNCQVTDVYKLWICHWESMADDILYKRRELTGNPNLNLNEEQLQNYALAEIEGMLNTLGKSLTHFPTIPMPSSLYLDKCINRLILEERSYDTSQMHNEHKDLVSKLNVEQKHVYDAVIESVYKDNGGLFFVYGSGGCGKTFLWRTIIARLRSESLIVLPVASSGIAATLLPGGRTAHSRFKIPLKLDESSTCSIPAKSDIAELLKQTKLIIWDEAPMQHRYAFEALDRTLRDIMKSVSIDKFDKPFGGITVLMGGDFRQILPVIYKGLRSDIVSACISRSPLWSMCQLFKLVHNMRLNQGNSDIERRRIKEFSQWILNLGDGKVTVVTNDCSDSNCSINVPPEFCIQSETADINELIDTVFPNLISSYSSVNYLRERSILTPRNKVVDHVNNLMLGKILGEEFTYFSSDSVKCCAGEDDQLTASFPVEHLNSIKLPGIPPHNLVLKVGVVVMLLRNMNQAMGLCNGTRMIVRRCLKHTIVCEIISGSNAGTTHLIPRIEMCPTDTNLPFQLARVQYPLQVCFAMTINKAQGQSLERVGLYLPEPVFCHGQYYVAVSRVTSPDGLIMFIEKPEGGTTTVTDNVVYEEIFYNVEDM